MPGQTDVTLILSRWNTDREAVLEELTPLVYSELRKIAASYLRRQRPNHTLQPTALINEAYLKLVNQQSANFGDRAHFYAAAAQIMRRILVDQARSHQAEKRGSGNVIQADAELAVSVQDRSIDVITIHQALEKLAEHNERIAKALELRYFGGLQLDETAAALSVSLATLKRDLALGEAWLRRALAGAR